MNDIYNENGFENREAYLMDLAERNNIDYDMVVQIADMLGPNEDFDGLLSSLEDALEMGFDEY